MLAAQRDSDANTNMEDSRLNAFGKFTELDLQVDSTLEKQFETSYIPRVFHSTLPWCVGGPDFPNAARYRRSSKEAEPIFLDDFTAMMTARCEYQIRADPVEPVLRYQGESRKNSCMEPRSEKKWS